MLVIFSTLEFQVHKKVLDLYILISQEMFSKCLQHLVATTLEHKTAIENRCT